MNVNANINVTPLTANPIATTDAILSAIHTETSFPISLSTQPATVSAANVPQVFDPIAPTPPTPNPVVTSVDADTPSVVPLHVAPVVEVNTTSIGTGVGVTSVDNQGNTQQPPSIPIPTVNPVAAPNYECCSFNHSCTISEQIGS